MVPTTRTQIPRASGLWPNKAKMRPSWAEQGTARAKRKVAMILSRVVSRVRVTTVAIVSQPSPRVKGMTARPLSPTFLHARSARRASRGRYPVSSRKEKKKKKVPTTGRMIPTAYRRPKVTIP